jgi:hypothetical protein
MFRSRDHVILAAVLQEKTLKDLQVAAAGRGPHGPPKPVGKGPHHDGYPRGKGPYQDGYSDHRDQWTAPKRSWTELNNGHEGKGYDAPPAKGNDAPPAKGKGVPARRKGKKGAGGDGRHDG